MVLVFIDHDQIAKGVEIRLLAAVQFLLSVRRSIIAWAASRCPSDLIDTRGSS